VTGLWRRRRDSGGFTLVEMVMAVAILGIMSTSIGVVAVVMFRTMNQTQNRLDETRGPRFASVYWIPDVASAETVNPASTDAPARCGPTGELVTLRWDDYKTGVTTVSYATSTAADGKLRLVRRFCQAGSTTPTRTTVIAPSIAATDGAVITCGNGTTYSGCGTPDTRKSLLLAVTGKSGGGTYSIDAFREVT
jgi:prepilin-type N-terminal cleavage/methylation domain-containing protein